MWYNRSCHVDRRFLFASIGPLLCLTSDLRDNSLAKQGNGLLV
jgi:hypothetical protein